MYLEFLKGRERELCIELAINLASTDGNFSQKERLLIEGQCADAGVTYDFRKELTPLQEIIECLIAESNLTERKIIVFEMVRLAIVDNVFHENEKDLIGDLAVQFELEDSYIEQCKEVLEAYMNIEEKINLLVLNQVYEQLSFILVKWKNQKKGSGVE